MTVLFGVRNLHFGTWRLGVGNVLCKMYTARHFTDVSSVCFSLLRVAVRTRVKYIYLRLTLVKHSVQQPCRRTAIDCYVILLPPRVTLCA